MKKVFAGIVAAGTGRRFRLEDSDNHLPKQFVKAAGKPILIHTLERMLAVSEICRIYIAVSPDMMEYSRNLLEEYLPGNDFELVEGGEDRDHSLSNILRSVCQNQLHPEDIIVTHDAVRPFITHDIIRETIKTAEMLDGSCVVLPSVDTLGVTSNWEYIDEIPPRGNMMRILTPQTFKILAYLECYRTLTESQRASLTDACQVLVSCGRKVGVVLGNEGDFKITQAEDLLIADIRLRKT